MGELVVIFVGGNNGGLGFLLSIFFGGGGYILCIYIVKGECVGDIFVVVRMFWLELISVEYINII